MFISEDWRSPFIQYLTEGILPQNHSERYMFKRLATHYFLHNTILFKREYDGDPLRCLDLEEAREVIKKSTLRRVWGALREEKALQMPAANGVLLAYHEERHGRICKKMPQLPNTSQFDPHPFAEFAWHGHTMALPHLRA